MRSRSRAFRRNLLPRALSVTAAEFDPLEHAAIFAAYRADTTDTATNFDWTDLTGNGHTLRQATTDDKPTVTTAAELGGREVIRFDGVSDYLAAIDVAATYTFLHDGAGADVWAVGVMRDNTAGESVIDTYSAGAATGFRILRGGTGPVVRTTTLTNAGGFSADLTSTGPFTQDQPFIVRVTVKTGATREVELFANGASVANSALTTPGTNAPPATLNVGRRPNGSSFCQVDLAAIYIFSDVLSTSDATSMQDLLSTYYAL